MRKIGIISNYIGCNLISIYVSCSFLINENILIGKTCVLLWLSSVCWDKNRHSHLGYFGHRCGRFISKQSVKDNIRKTNKETPSKGGGKPASRSARYKTGSGGREKWNTPCCDVSVKVELVPQLPHFHVRSNDVIPHQKLGTTASQAT